MPGRGSRRCKTSTSGAAARQQAGHRIDLASPAVPTVDVQGRVASPTWPGSRSARRPQTRAERAAVLVEAGDAESDGAAVTRRTARQLENEEIIFLLARWVIPSFPSG